MTINHASSMSRKLEEPFKVENGHLHPEVIAVGHHCTYEPLPRG